MQLVASVSVPVVDAGHWIGCSLPCRAPFSRALTCVLYLSLRYKKNGRDDARTSPRCVFF